MSKDIAFTPELLPTTFAQNTHVVTNVTVSYIADENADTIARDFQSGNTSNIHNALFVQRVTIRETKVIRLNRPR